MKSNMDQTISTVLLVITVLLFFYKGLVFAFLDSFVPLIISLIFTGCLILSKLRSDASYRIAKKVWAYILLAWSAIRVILAVLIVTTLNEAYLLDQINLSNLLLTIFLCASAYYLLKANKTRT